MPAGSLSDVTGVLRMLRPAVLVAAAAALLAACEGEVETISQEPRPVRAVTVDKRDAGAPVHSAARCARLMHQPRYPRRQRTPRRSASGTQSNRRTAVLGREVSPHPLQGFYRFTPRASELACP